ncbi:MAG: hypothetical protein WCD20_04055 [Rhodomicrobium sp.]
MALETQLLKMLGIRYPNPLGLPEQHLPARVKAAGCKVLSKAKTVAGAPFLGSNGADAIIATTKLMGRCSEHG